MIINLNTLIWIVLSIILVGFFAGIEVAFSGINRLNVELKKKQGKKSGLLFSYFIDDPTRFIGFVLVGFNVFLVVYGLLIGHLLQPGWNYLISKMNWPSGWVYLIKLVFETITSTLIILLVGEFIPRAIWRVKSDWLLTGFFSSIIAFWHRVFQPLATFFVTVSEWILKYIFNVRVDEKKSAFSRADLENYFNESNKDEDDPQGLNAELIENALSLPGVKIRKCLIPRKEIVGVEIKMSIEQAQKKFVETQLSKLVVYKNSIDHIIGYIHQLDLFSKPQTVEQILLPIPAVPESMSASDLISKFTRERKSMAWVVDEFGGTAGIVTMEDLLEEIFGEIKDEYDTEDFEEKQLNENEFMFSGRLELDYLNEKYGFHFKADDADTLSGYIIASYEKIPRIKERIILGDYEFDIITVSDTRIEMVKIKHLR
jgi:putative hemolysin